MPRHNWSQNWRQILQNLDIYALFEVLDLEIELFFIYIKLFLDLMTEIETIHSIRAPRLISNAKHLSFEHVRRSLYQRNRPSRCLASPRDSRACPGPLLRQERR